MSFRFGINKIISKKMSLRFFFISSIFNVFVVDLLNDYRMKSPENVPFVSFSFRENKSKKIFFKNCYSLEFESCNFTGE